jgi:putative phosphotransacetylase
LTAKNNIQEIPKMKKVIVETSARHIHVSKEALEVLFGKGYELTKKKDLSQPGQYACEEKLVVVGPKGSLKASILGPTRPATQVEISLTDARSIGVSAPIRESGDTVGSGACKLVNPDNGAEYELTEGVIAAKRHIHLTPEAAAEFGVADKEIVCVKVASDSERTTIFGDVVVRVSEKFAPAMHIDTDEANAAFNVGREVYGEIVK